MSCLKPSVCDVLARAAHSPSTANFYFLLPHTCPFPACSAVLQQGIKCELSCGCHRSTSRLMSDRLLTRAMPKAPTVAGWPSMCSPGSSWRTMDIFPSSVEQHSTLWGATWPAPDPTNPPAQCMLLRLRNAPISALLCNHFQRPLWPSLELTNP